MANVGSGDSRPPQRPGTPHQFLQSVEQQTYPKTQLRVHVMTEGNSEEAKAFGILRSTGELIGMFCADNVLREPDFLEVMANAAQQTGVVGSYTARYAYVSSDASLNRYFALLGSNDPLCWWVGKADRESYLAPARPGRRETFSDASRLPSLGDNGCVFKRECLKHVNILPNTFGSCMCFCEDLRRAGYSTWSVVSTHALWHRTGQGFWTFIRRRIRYVRTLYFNKQPIRRWHLVATPRDWAAVVGFAVASVLVVPQMLVSLRGYRSVQDRAWLWHPVVCFALTLGYAWAFLMSALSFRRLIVNKS